jgi:hypothetical protein
MVCRSPLPTGVGKPAMVVVGVQGAPVMSQWLTSLRARSPHVTEAEGGQAIGMASLTWHPVKITLPYFRWPPTAERAQFW